MGIVLGTNAGFVTEAPTSDPGGTNISMDAKCRAVRDTAPTGATTITEIGWYCDNATEEADFEVGLYDHNSGNNVPGNIIEKSGTKAKGLDAGWKFITGLSIPITSSTIYWIAEQLDTTTTSTNINFSASTDNFMDKDSNKSALADPWTGTSPFSNNVVAVYAIYEEEAPTGTNTQINIGDAWKEISAIKINIGDAWKDVEGAQINIGDAWKTIF